MRYFLHIRDGERLIEDPDGEELSSMEAARREALDAARDLMATDLRHSRLLGEDRSIEICDADGRLVASVPFGEAIRRKPPVNSPCPTSG